MSFTSEELDYLGQVALDYTLANAPIDQIGTDHPLLDALMKTRRTFPGGKQYVVEQLRMAYDSNFQWVKGDAEVTYNRRRTIKQSNFGWSGVFDGYFLNEDELLADGVIIDDSGNAGQATDAERVTLTNIFEENTEALRLGFEEKFDYQLHLDGSQDADAIGGLDYLVGLVPGGTVGGIDATTYTWWQNVVDLDIDASTPSNLVEAMEQKWLEVKRYKGKVDLILMGTDFANAFRQGAEAQITRYIQINTKGGTGMDPSVPDLYFHGIPCVWDPTLAQLDTDLAPPELWEKRCYWLDTKSIRLRPAQGHDMRTTKPPVVYNRPGTHYWGLVWKGALTINKRNSNAVLTIL